MKYAVVKIGGSQYKVKEGDEFEVDRLPNKEEEEIKLSDVLLVVDEGQAKIGQPIVPSAQVTAKVVSHLKGVKVRVARFKAKSRYRKVRGFRAALTKIKIEKIGVQVEEKVKEEKKTAKRSVSKTQKTSAKKS